MYFLFLMILAMVLWGIGWPALKIVTESVCVDIVTFWRFFIMFVSFIPILIWLKKPICLNKQSLKIVLISAVLNIAFMFFSYWGVKNGTAGAGGVIITTISPVLTIILAIWWLKAKVHKNHWIGLAIGVIGGAIMLEVWNVEIIFEGGNIFFFLCALVWAVLTLLSQKSHQHLEPIHYSFLLSVIATVVMYGVTFNLDITVVFEQDWRFWSALLFLAILGQSVATTIYFVASGKLGSSVASSYMFIVPLSALVASYLLLGEVPSFWLLSGGILSTFSLYFINKKEKKQ
jgi:drug/metabolite transporter (DMT)-like permease